MLGPKLRLAPPSIPDFLGWPCCHTRLQTTACIQQQVSTNVTAKHLNHLVSLSRAHLASVGLTASTPPVAITAVTTCSLLPQGSVIGGGIKRQRQQGWGLGGY